MKTIKTTVKLIAITCLLTIFSCSKEGEQGVTGPTGPSGASGPQAKTFNFSLTFNSGDTFKAYSGITGYTADDLILYYVFYEAINSTNYWAPMPIIVEPINMIPEFSEQTGLTFINVKKSNGQSGSPITSTVTYAFKAVLISSSQRLIYPNIDYSNYYEVKGAFNLED